MTIRETLCWGEEKLREAGILEARLDAWYLLEYSFSISCETFLLHSGKEAGKPETENYKKLVKKRAEHEPLQYLTGVQEFMGFPFKVNKSVLIPRQDTEVLVEEVLKAGKDKKILDLCTGSGCIIVSLCNLACPKEAVGADISREALKVAKENGRAFEAKVAWIESDLFENIEGKFDIIVSNPPYIESREIGQLMPEVRDYEPWLALDGKEDGLYFYKKIIKGAKDHLEENGELFLEIGCSQGKAVSELLDAEGYKEIRVKKDLAGLDRVVAGKC